MQIRILALAGVICATAAGQSPAPYSAIEVDPFVSDLGVAFPTNYQKELVEDIARESSVLFRTAIILRAGDAPPFGHAVLRISGTVRRFASGPSAKGLLPGFGSSGISVRAQVRFADASSGQVLLIRQVKGTMDPKGAGDSLARQIAKLCDENRFLQSQ
jgi:hypothetical protein